MGLVTLYDVGSVNNSGRTRPGSVGIPRAEGRRQVDQQRCVISTYYSSPLIDPLKNYRAYVQSQAQIPGRIWPKPTFGLSTDLMRFSERRRSDSAPPLSVLCGQPLRVPGERTLIPRVAGPRHAVRPRSRHVSSQKIVHCGRTREHLYCNRPRGRCRRCCPRRSRCLCLRLPWPPCSSA